MYSNGIRAIISATALTIATASYASSFYVATAGDDGNSGRTADSPLHTIATAANMARPGDTIWLLPGRYREPVVPPRSGTIDKPITYAKYGQGSVVIVSGSAASKQAAVYISGISDIVVNGIDANGGGSPPNAALNSFITIDNSSRITIKNGEYANANGWWGIGVSNSSSHVIIEDNKVDMVGEWEAPSSRGGTGEGIIVDQALFPPFQHGNPTYVLVQRNRITHCGHDLVTIGGQFNVAQDNYLDNDWSDIRAAPAGYRNAVVFGSDNIFQNNYLTHSGPGPAKYLYDELLRIEGSNNIVRHNVLANSYYQAFQSNAGSWTPNGCCNHIYNNTVNQIAAGAWGLYIYPGYTRSNDVFENNLIVNSRNTPPPANNSNNFLDFALWVKVESLGPTGGAIITGNMVAPAGGQMPTLFSDAIGKVSLSEPGSALSTNVFSNPVGTPRFAITPVSSAPTAQLVLNSYALAPDSPAVDQGSFLARIMTTGNSATLPVSDARFFTDGLGMIPGDTIRLQGSDAVQITHVNYLDNTITLARAVAFSAGQGVSLTFSGRGPYIGAIEP
jgi:hypothetical protein